LANKTKSTSTKSVRNKSIKQSKKTKRGQTGKKGRHRKRAPPAGRGRLGGGGPSAHPPKEQTPTATLEPQQPAPGSPEERNLTEIGSTFKPDELEL
jgi:hypothetical protein